MSSRQGVWALCDQAAVSAANFLVIALGAWMLELTEQTQLVYVYTAYIALVLFNASALFSAAPMLRHEVEEPTAYQNFLLRMQVAVALCGSVMFILLFAMLGARFGWQPDSIEMLWMGGFLLLQQLADFNRRADYVFGDVRRAGIFSVLMLLLRVGGLLFLRPDTATVFYAVLTCSALPGAISTIARGWIGRDSAHEPDLFRRHLRLARWSVLNAPLQWVGLHLPIYLAGMLVSANAAAILASVRSVSAAVNVFLELIETYVPAWMASRARHEGSKGVMAVATSLYIRGGIVWVIAALAILLFGETLLELLLGPVYAEYWPILFILWVGNGLYFAGRIYGVQHRVSRRTSVELVGSMGGG